MAAGRDVAGGDSVVASREEGPYLLLRCLPSGGEYHESRAMNEALWQNIPEELLHRLLALLPPKSIARFRSVCKAWRHLLSSKAFLGRRDVHPIYGVELIGRNQAMTSSGVTFSTKPIAADVKVVDLSFLRGKFRSIDGSVYVAVDGLVCVYESRTTSRGSFCVFNPWTKECKELAQCNQMDLKWERVCLAVEKVLPMRFKVLVCTLVGHGGPAYLYTSDTNNWTTLWRKGAHRECSTRYPYWPQFLFTSSRMVAIYKDIREPAYDYDLEAYDSDLPNEAYGVEAVRPYYEDRTDRNMRYPVKILEYEGEVYMITGNDALYVNGARRWRPDKVQVAIWKLSSEGLWCRVSSIPAELATSLTAPGERWEHFPGDAAVIGDTIYVSITVRRPDPCNSRKYIVLCSHLVLYRVLSDCWEIWERDICPGLLGRAFRLFKPPNA